MDYEKPLGGHEKEMILRDFFYDPRKGFRSAEDLHKKLKEVGHEISLGFIRTWLRTQKTFTTHKKAVRKFMFSKTYVSNLGQQLQLDLVDMSFPTSRISLSSGSSRAWRS